jgi:polyadenylate-binding protein
MGEDARLLVQGLSAKANEESIRALFSDFATLQASAITLRTRRDRTGRSRYYVTVQFDSRETADRVFSAMHYTNFNGVPIQLIHADPDRLRIFQSGENRILAWNLDPDILAWELDEGLSHFGEVLSCEVPRGEDGLSKPFGHVQFRHAFDAAQALESLQEAPINGRPLRLRTLGPGEIPRL